MNFKKFSRTVLRWRYLQKWVLFYRILTLLDLELNIFDFVFFLINKIIILLSYGACLPPMLWLFLLSDWLIQNISVFQFLLWNAAQEQILFGSKTQLKLPHRWCCQIFKTLFCALRLSVGENPQVNNIFRLGSFF